MATHNSTPKQCNKCMEYFPRTLEYFRKKKTKDGLGYTCRPCARILDHCAKLRRKPHVHKPLVVTVPFDGAIGLVLSQGAIAIIDNCDADLAVFKWSLTSNGYAKRDKMLYEKQRDGDDRRVIIYLHRVIMARMLSRDLSPDEEIDHMFSDRLDNRRSQLRLATRLQNSRNIPRHKDNASGYKGVYFSAQAGRWHSQIMVNGTRYSLGYFDT